MSLLGNRIQLVLKNVLQKNQNGFWENDPILLRLRQLFNLPKYITKYQNASFLIDIKD